MVEEVWNVLRNYAWMREHYENVQLNFEEETVTCDGMVYGLEDMEFPLADTPWGSEDDDET